MSLLDGFASLSLTKARRCVVVASSGSLMRETLHEHSAAHVRVARVSNGRLYLLRQHHCCVVHWFVLTGAMK